MLSGTFSARALCHPAWSMITTAWSVGSSSALSIPRNTLIVPVLTHGACNATLDPVAGSTAA